MNNPFHYRMEPTTTPASTFNVFLKDSIILQLDSVPGGEHRRARYLT